MSMTIVGLLAAVLAKLAQTVGYDGQSVTAENLMTTGMTIMQVVGLLVAWRGRVRKGDITWYGKKLTPNITIDSLPE